jgi:hypothetical protein
MTKRNFEEWKSILKKDCERHEKLAVLDALGDYVLKLLWRAGIEPSVRAIGDGSREGEGGGEKPSANKIPDE